MTKEETSQNSLAPPLAGGLPPVTLVLGGVRSGKSHFAEDLIVGAGGGVYLATADASRSHGDTQMRQRIMEHQSRRANNWTTLEEPLDLAGALLEQTGGQPVLVDCLTLWLTNLLDARMDIPGQFSNLETAISRLKSPVVFVSNEVGLGIVPQNALAREFRDHAGRLHQMIASSAQRVVFMTAGLPQYLKDET